MKKILLLIIFFASLSMTVYSQMAILNGLNYVLPAVPKTEDATSLYNYLNVLYQRWNVEQISTREPNGNIDSDYGQGIVYNNSGTFYFAVETTSPHGTTWVGIQLGSI